MKIKKEILIIFILGIFIRIIPLFLYTTNNLIHYDDANNLFFSKVFNFKLFYPNAQSEKGAEPLFFWYLKIIQFFTQSVVLIKLTIMFMSVITSIYFYKMAINLFNKKTALTGLFLLTFNPSWILINHLLWRINLQIMFISFCFYFLSKYFKKTNNLKDITISCFFLFLSILTYTSSIPVIITVFFIFFFHYNKKPFRRKSFLIYFTLLFLLTTPFLFQRIKNKEQFSTITFNLNPSKFNIFTVENKELNIFKLKNLFGLPLINTSIIIINFICIFYNLIILILSTYFAILKKNKILISFLIILIPFIFFLNLTFYNTFSLLFILHAIPIKISKKIFFSLFSISLFSVFFYHAGFWRCFGLKEASDFLIEKNYDNTFIDEQMDTFFLFYIGDKITLTLPNYPNKGYNTIFIIKNGKQAIPYPLNKGKCWSYVSWANGLPDNVLSSFNEFNLVKTIYYNNIPIIRIHEFCA